jgi:hypothetical protein
VEWRDRESPCHREALMAVQLSWMGVWPWGAQVRRTVGWSMKPG